MTDCELTNMYLYSSLTSLCHCDILITKQDPEKEDVEWMEKMFSDRRSSPSAAPDLTPLHMAIYKQHPEVAHLLIEKDANVNKKDHFGLTPFMLCALRSKFLVEHDLTILISNCVGYKCNFGFRLHNLGGNISN